MYLVTAKHVPRDFDGRFLPKLRVRMNLKTPTNETGVDFVAVAVSGGNGNLSWFHDEKDLQTKP